MTTETQLRPSAGPLVWIGLILSTLLALFLMFTSTFAIMQKPFVMDQMVKQFGFPASAIMPIGIAEGVSALLYLIPRTSVLGAILLTAYLGGATATHVHISDPKFVMPIVVGVLVWIFLLLREPRLRSLLPWRRF